MRLKTPEQRERFRDFILPMPVPQSLKDKIRSESEKAKQLAASIQKKPMELPIGSEK